MDEEGPTGVVYGAVSAARTGMHLPFRYFIIESDEKERKNYHIINTLASF